MVFRSSKPGKEGITHFFNRIHELQERAIEDLKNTELNWRPSPNSNTIGNLLKHIAGSEAFWVHHVAGGMETKRDRPAEFEIRDFQITRLLEELNHVKKVTMQVLAELTNEQLAEIRQFPPLWASDEQQTTTVHWCLMHAIEHSAQHIGQIFYIRKMYADR